MLRQIIHKSFTTLTFIAVLSSCTKENASNTETPAVIEAATANATGICGYDPDAGSLIGWTELLSENFDGGAVNTNTWNIWTGGAFNNELQHYQAGNLTVSDGILSIAAKKQKVSGYTNPWSTRLKNFNYTSGRIETKLLYSPSPSTPIIRMMARIKLPAGYGMWPAFWSYGDPWPTKGEIDILEARGQEPFTYSTNYFYGSEPDKNLVTNSTSTINSSTSLQSCWHVYELIWDQNALRFYFDGQLVDTKTGGYVADLFGKQEKIVLNLAVGGNFFSRLIARNILPGTMSIDWVRVYSHG